MKLLLVRLTRSPHAGPGTDKRSAPSKGVSLTFKGPDAPDPFGGEPRPQSFNVRILCDIDASDPVLSSYDGSALWVDWHANAGCAMGSEPPVDIPDPGGETSVGSGLGYFFLLYVSSGYKRQCQY